MRIFLDTEFTDTPDGPSFISAAFLTDDSRTLYSERPIDATERLLQQHPNGFVRREVLPQLGRVDGVPWEELPACLAAWLDGLGVPEVDVVYDYGADYLLVERLLAQLDHPPAVKLHPTHCGYLLDDADGKIAASSSWQALEATFGFSRHHALADVYALRARFEAVHPVVQRVEPKTVELLVTVTAVIEEFELVQAEAEDGTSVCIGKRTKGVDWRTLVVGQRLRCAAIVGNSSRVLSATVEGCLYGDAVSPPARVPQDHEGRHSCSAAAEEHASMVLREDAVEGLEDVAADRILNDAELGRVLSGTAGRPV